MNHVAQEETEDSLDRYDTWAYDDSCILSQQARVVAKPVTYMTFFFFCFFVCEISQGFSLHLSISKLPHTDITFAPHLVCWHFSPLINTPAEMMGLLVGVHVLKYAKNALFSAGAGGLHRNHLNQYKWEADEFWTFDHTLNVTLHLISGMFKD